MKQVLIHDIQPFVKEGAGISQWSLLTPSCVSSFHNAKERDKWHSRCRQKPIAFATYCMICRGIVQKPSPFSWVCDVYGSIRDMQILSRGRIFAQPPTPSRPPAAWLSSVPLSRIFCGKVFGQALSPIVSSKTDPSRRLDYTSDVCVDAYRTFSESRGDHFMHACLRRLNHYGNTIVSGAV